jgi:ER lumen protein retaining receptor
MLHLLSIMLLVFKLHKSKSCVGVSCRMQEMYALVFCFRYLDLLWSFISLYNTVMKIIFITTTMYLIWLMRYKAPISQTYDRATDSFQYELYLLPPCFVLGLICTDEYTLPDILWTSSIWLESVAIIPQLVLLQQIREVENLTSDFVGTMGAYRAFYILNWVYRYFAEDYTNVVGWIGGVVQTALYCDFFYYYAKSKWYGNRLVLPTAA